MLAHLLRRGDNNAKRSDWLHMQSICFVWTVESPCCSLTSLAPLFTCQISWRFLCRKQYIWGRVCYGIDRGILRRETTLCGYPWQLYHSNTSGSGLGTTCFPLICHRNRTLQQDNARPRVVRVCCYSQAQTDVPVFDRSRYSPHYFVPKSRISWTRWTEWLGCAIPSNITSLNSYWPLLRSGVISVKGR